MATAAAAEIPETLPSTETVILMERIVSEFTINGVGELDHLHKPIEHLEEPEYNHVEGGQREGESFFQSPSLPYEYVVEEVKLQKDRQSEAVEKIEPETELLKDHNEGVGGGGTTDAEEQNQEEAEDKLNLSALIIEEETPMVIKEDCLLPKETEDKSLDADAISEDSGGQNFTLIQDEERVESRAVEVEAEVASFEPLEQVSEDTEVTKELETLNKDKTEAIREIAFAEDPTVEEGHQLIQEADEENETAGVKETQYEDDSEADKCTEVVLEDHASTEKVNQTGDGDKENTDDKAEQPTAALDVEVDVSGGEQGGALEYKQKEEPEEVNDEQGQQVHDDQSLLKVIEDQEPLTKESPETTQRETCILQKSENETEVAENVSIGDVTRDDGEGPTETKEEVENPEIVVTEISSVTSKGEVKMDSEEVNGSTLEKACVVNEDAEEQNQEETEDKTNLSAVIEEETEDKSIDTNVISEDAEEKQGHPPIQETEQLTVAVEDAKPENSKDDEDNKTVEAKETTSKDDIVEAEESTDVLAEHASMEKENEVNQIGDEDKETGAALEGEGDVSGGEQGGFLEDIQTPNEYQVEETNTAYTEQSEVNSSVEIAEPSVPCDSAEASTPPLPLELIESSSSVVVAESEVAETVEEEVQYNSYLNEEKETSAIGDSADETVLPASEACEVLGSGVKAKEYLEEASYVELDVNGNTQAETEEAGTQVKESQTMEVPEIHIKSEDAEGKDTTEELEKQPASIGAAKDSVCDDISNEEGVNDEQASTETSGEVKKKAVDEIVHAEEIHEESASVSETEDQNEDPATILEGIIEKDVDAEVQNQEETADKLNLSAVIEEEPPMVNQEDSLQPKKTEDKSMDADAISEDAGEGQDFTLIQDEEQVESRALEMEVEIARFEPLEQVSEDTEATKEPETLIKDNTEAVREITFVVDPKTEEVNQTGDVDEENTDNIAEQPTASLDVEVGVSGGEQGGALEDKKKEEPEEVIDEQEQVDEPIHDDQSLLKVIEEQESLSKETTETTETEACPQQKSEKEIEVADNVSIVVVTQDEGEGVTDTKEDPKVAEDEFENPEIAVVEISSVKVESEEVKGLVLEKPSIVNEDAEEQNQEETEDKPNLSAVIEEETEIVNKEDSLHSKETEDKSTDANAITISEDGGEEQGHSSIQEAEQLTVALENEKPEKSEENETVEAKETSKDDLEAEENTYVVLAEHASLEKENEVSQIGDGDKETADKEEDIQKEEVSPLAELQTPNEYQVEEINTAYAEQISEPSVFSDVAEASTPPLPLELAESSSSVAVAESEMEEAMEEEVESNSYLSEEKETPSVGDSADETVPHASKACEVPNEYPEEASYVDVEVNGNTQADNEEAKSGTQEKESETKEVVSSEIEVPEIHINSEDAEGKDNIEETEKQPAASVGSAKDSTFDDVSNEGVNDEQGSAETGGAVKEEVIEEVGQVEKILEGSASIPETENHATIVESIIEKDVTVESEETENLESSSAEGVNEVFLEKEEPQRTVDFEVDEKKPKDEDEALESPVQDCNPYENESMANEITTQEEQSASEQVQDVEMQNVGEVNELIHDGNSTGQGHSSIQEAEQLTVALEDENPEKSEENETVEAKETSKDDLEAQESTYVVLAEHASLEKENDVSQIGDGDKETANKEPIADLDADRDVSGGKWGGSLEDIEEKEISPLAELQTPNEYQVEETNTAYAEQLSEPSVLSDAAEAYTPPLPLELVERSSSVVVAEREMVEAEEKEVESNSYLSEEKETSTVGDSADETVPHASKACEVPEFGVKPNEYPEEASYVDVEVNDNTQADNEEAKSGTQEKESETKEVVSSEVEVPEIHINSEDAEGKDNIEEPEKQPAASVGSAKDSIFDDISNEGVNDEQGSAETGGEVKEEVIEEVGQVEKIHEGSASIPETENHATIFESIVEKDVTVESEETENLEPSSAEGVKEVFLEKEEPQRQVDFEVDEKKLEDEALESPVQDCNTYENESMANEITTQEEQSASEQVQDVEMQNVDEVNELIHDGNSTEQKVDEYVDEIQVEGGDTKDIHETLAQHEESDCVIASSEDNETATNGNVEVEETIAVQEKDASVEVNGQITEEVPSEIEVNIKSEEGIDEHKIEKPESTDAANSSICDIISNEGVSGEQGNAETLIEERDADLPLVDNTEANDAEKEKEVNNLESKEPPVDGSESNSTEIERSKMQMQDSSFTAQTEDAGEATQEVIMEENASYDKTGSEDREGEDLDAEVVEVLREQPTEEPASYESIQESEEVSKEKPISDTQHEEHVSNGETASGSDFPSVELGDEIDEIEPTLATELTEDSATIVDDTAKEAVTVESEETEKHELSTAADNEEVCLEKEEPQQFEASEGARDIECEVGELKESEDEEVELIQSTITTQEGPEKDASVLFKEDVQEETFTTIQEIVEGSGKECVVEPPEVNGHTESGNEAVATTITQGKESEITEGLTSEDVDDEQKIEEPEKQPKSTDDSICDHISNEGVNNEQTSAETSEEVEEQVVEKQNTSEENEIGNTEEIHQTSDEHVAERSCDIEMPVIKEEISSEDEITVTDVKEETPTEEVHTVQGQVDESGIVKLGRDEEAEEDEITKAEEEPEEHVSSGETTSGSDFPSVELGDQIDTTETTVAIEQIEDYATVVGNITEEAVTVESEESDKHESSSAADKEEVCLKKEEAQQSEGAQDIQCEVGELKESEDGQNELIQNVITTNEGQDGSDQVPNAEKQSISEVQDEFTAEQKVDEEAAKDDEDAKRNVEGDETVIVQENDSYVVCKEDVEEKTSTTIQETVEESEKECLMKPSEVNGHTETETEAVAAGNQEDESETIEDLISLNEVPETHKKSEDDDGNKFEELEKEPKSTDDSICDHVLNEGVNDGSAETSEAVEQQVFEEVVEKQNISEENELNQKLDGIEKADERESLKLEDDSNAEEIDQALVEHVTERSCEIDVADVNEETPIEEVHIVQGEDKSGNVKPERDEEEVKDEITKGDVENEETIILQENDATEDGTTVEEVVREIDVIKEDITESEGSDSKNLDLESAEEQHEIVTETDKSIISTEEVHDEDIESDKTLEWGDTKPIYETSVQQLTSNKEADFEEHGERDSGILEATSETESSAMKLEETEDEEISCSIEGANEAVKELISEIPSIESQPDKEIKKTEVSSHVTYETIKEETRETETKESITEAEDSETRNLKIQDEAEKQHEIVNEKIEPIQDGNSHAEVDNGHEVFESESIILETGGADDTNEENEAEENAKASESSSVELQEVIEEKEQIIYSREIKSEPMAETEPKETISGSEDSEIKISNFEETCAADVSKSENVAVAKEVNIVDDEVNLIGETSSRNLAVSEGIGSVSVEANDETKEVGDQSSIEMVTLIEREIESSEAHIDNSTETGIASCVTRELIREGDDETEEAATTSESSTAEQHKEEGMSSILQERDAEEHIEEETAEEAHSIESVTPLEEETKALTSEVNHETVDSEAKNLNLEEATILDVIEADEKEITYEEGKGIVSGECIEAEDTSVRITEGGDENETREAEITSTVTEITSEVEPEVEKEEPENSGLENLNLEEVTAVDDVKLSSLEAEGPVSGEYKEAEDGETKETVSLTFEAKEIISETAENKPISESAGSEINSLNLEEVTTVDAKQSENVIDANDEVHETAGMIKEATQETEVDGEKVRGASEGVRFTEEEEKYENEATKEKDVDAAKEIYETITEERESSTAFPSTVQSEYFKEFAEKTDSSYDKSLGVDEAEEKFNEVANEKGSELTSKEEEGGLQDCAPKDAVISEGGPQIVSEDRKITPEVKSQVQSRDIFTGPEVVEGGTKPAPENIHVHPKEVEDNHETIGVVERNIDSSYVVVGGKGLDDKAELSLSDLLHKARDQNQKVATPLTEERDIVGSTLEVVHNEEADAHEAKTDEERDESEVMGESSKDIIDVKTPPKKHTNILSGVSSKVKHSISKVKKAITGKSFNSKTPK